MIRTGRSLARLLRGSRRWLAVSAVLTVLQSALLVPIGLILRHVLDRTIPEDRVGALVASGVLILALSLGSAGLGLLTRYLVLAATKSAVSRMRIALVARLQALPTAWLDHREIGDLHSIIVQDSERADGMFNAIANQLVPAVIIAGALCAALVVINPLLFLLLTAIVPFMLLGSHRLGNLMRRRTRAWVRAFDHFSTRMHFTLRAHTLVRTHSAEPRELEAATAEIDGLSLAGRSMAWTQNAYAQANGTLAVVGGVVVLVVGGAAVAHGTMTLGSLLAFYALVVFLRGQTSVVLAAVPLVISGSESLARLEAILDSDETEPYTGTRPLAFGGSISLRDVHFEYREGVPVLQGVDLDMCRGERVALVGPNGSGKSTIAGLILGLYRPRRGAVLADGVPFDDVDMRALRRRIAVVQQDPFLFPGTIAQNIAYGAPDADEEAVRTAARRATADDFIATLPAGYDTPVGDAGTLLSGGQRQRIAIARSLVREPRLLILDEPTSSLDRGAVSVLLARLRDLPRQPAVLIISHDPEIVAEADRVYAIEAGVAQPLAIDAESMRMSG